MNRYQTTACETPRRGVRQHEEINAARRSTTSMHGQGSYMKKQTEEHCEPLRRHISSLCDIEFVDFEKRARFYGSETMKRNSKRHVHVSRQKR